MGRGFECGDGWYALIDVACSVISAPYLSAERHYEWSLEQLQDENPEIDATAVERARQLMEALWAALPVALQVKEKLGTLRFYLKGGGERTRACTEFAGYMSESVCELCARPGVLLQSSGWMRVRCGRCDAEHDSNQMEQA